MRKRDIAESDLLTPSLAADAENQPQAIYPPIAMMLAAFFGGPFAILAMTGANTQRLKRTARDAPYLLLAAAATVLLIKVLFASAVGKNLADTAIFTPKLLIRAFAIALFSGSYFLHRRAHRNSKFSGLDAPKSIPMTLACIIGGSAVTAAIVKLLQL
jgi:hypothetical protein